MRMLKSIWFTVGGLAQLGERLHGMQEVTGSSPVSSTIFLPTTFVLPIFVSDANFDAISFLICW